MKIKTKVSYIVLLVIVITGITAISISGFVSRNLIKNEIYNHLDNVAHSKAHHIETLFIECQDIVKILATEKIFLETGADAQDLMMQRINEIIHINKKITHISIVDQNAKIIVPDDNHTRNYQEFIISSQKGTYLKDIHISPLTGKHIISISTPILQEGKLVRLLIIDIDVENSLYNITKDRTGLGKTGEIYLLNHEGYMISPSRFLKDTFLNIQVTSPKAQECLGRDTQNNTYLDYRGNIVIGTSHFIEGMNWCLIAEIEAAEAFAPVDKLIWMIFLFFLMPLSVGILFALIMTETITRPISLLHKKIRGIEEGNWDYNIIIESHDEIGELSKSFDIMTEHLKVSRQRLETRRDELEKQVIARTLELDQKVETLRHSEERFRKIFEDGPIGMAIINKEQSFLKVNSAFANMVGYTASELIGQTITDISYPDDMPQNRAFMTQALKGERTYFQMEKRYIKKDGQIIWGNLAVSLLHNQEGEPIYFLAKVEDITKRKLADEEIRKLSIAIKQSPSISLITDLQGHIEYVNPKFTQVTGYTAEEVIGKNPRFLRSDDTDQQFYKKLWKTLFSGGELRSEFQNRKKNGEVYWEFASFSAIKNKEGTITHFLKVAEDITERKKAEFSLKEAKEVAVSANRAKSEFLA
ncbi:MAG: PAS domain S-box protein, partial [Thiomargarita sp.]|nr:PAS domain S-box protein [Thiomargarita sp.]